MWFSTAKPMPININDTIAINGVAVGSSNSASIPTKNITDNATIANLV